MVLLGATLFRHDLFSIGTRFIEASTTRFRCLATNSV
jgi:hypothetical protein